MRNSLICLISSLLFVNSVSARDIKFCGNLKQGEVIWGQTEKGCTVTMNGKSYPVSPEGYFMIAFSRNEPLEAQLNVACADGASDRFNLKVASAQWDIQRITGVPKRKVTPIAEDSDEIMREQKDMRRALSRVNAEGLNLTQNFVMPVQGRISGNFGNQRIFNGIPKNPHSGTDIAAPEGTPVRASGNGIIVLSGGNYFYSGNVIIIDHGYGLQTIYAHLKDTVAQVGDQVKQGDVIGHVGRTGRVTGPHLHWGASLNNVRFRPHSLLEIKSSQCQNYSASD